MNPNTQVDPVKVIQKLSDEVSRLNVELAMTRVALDSAAEREAELEGQLKELQSEGDE